MKLNCQIEVNDRTLNMSHLSLYKKKRQRGCLVIGRESTKKNELYILLQTQTNSCGTKYKLNDNIEIIFEKFIANGKATIRIKEPPHDLLIQSDPISLKGFIHVVKLAFLNKVNLSTMSISNLNTKKILNTQKTKLVIKNNSEYPTLKGFPRYTEELTIVGLNRKSFDLQILRLNNLKVLDLSKNLIRSLPKDLGSMPHLQELILAENHLGKTAFSKWNWLEQDNIRKNLRLLDLTSNWISSIPENILKLNGLVNLKLGYNSIAVLPQSMKKLTSLRYLDISHNHLRYLSGGIRKLKLSEIDISENIFLVDYKLDFKYNPLVSSLVECAAGVFLSTSISYDASMIPRTLVKYLDSATYCICGKACFKNYIRDILFFKLDLSVCVVKSSYNEPIPFECHFCSLCCYNRYKRISK